MLKPHQELKAKGKEIFDIVHQIGELIPEDSEELQHLKGQMLGDAMMLTAKVSGAEEVTFMTSVWRMRQLSERPPGI